MSQLPHIYWIHRPYILSAKIDEGDDYCGDCAVATAKKLKEIFPTHSDEIFACGGTPLRESDGLALCYVCGCDLSCYLLDDSLPEGVRCVDTLDAVAAALKAMNS